MRQAGTLATFTGWCHRCDGQIIWGVTRVTKTRGGWVHVGCASGADDE